MHPREIRELINTIIKPETPEVRDEAQATLERLHRLTLDEAEYWERRHKSAALEAKYWREAFVQLSSELGQHMSDMLKAQRPIVIVKPGDKERE